MIDASGLLGMPSSCVGMPSITTQYALNIKRRETVKSVTHRAYGAVCPVCTSLQACETDSRFRNHIKGTLPYLGLTL